MSEYIEVGQPLQFTDPNTPTRVGEIVENVGDIYNIPSPRVGMRVFVKSKKKSYVISSLKSKVVNGLSVPNAQVEAFRCVEDELIDRIQGRSEDSDAAKDPFKFLGTFTRVDGGEFLNALNAMHGTVARVYDGYWRALIGASPVEIYNFPIYYNDDRWIQVLKSPYRWVNGDFTIIGDDIRYRTIYRIHENDAWGEWRDTEQELKDEIGNLVKHVAWNDSSRLNDFTTAGVYEITGERKMSREYDNLPIDNSGSGHTISARLEVLDSSINETTNSDDKCITQKLTLSNRVGGDGNVYIRTGRGRTYDSITWEKWGTLQTNINVGKVGSLDEFVDNGIYSGVWTDGSSFAQTFVMVVINDYAVAGNNKTIVQYKYAYDTLKGNGEPTYNTRSLHKGVWSQWEDVHDDDLSVLEKTLLNAIEVETLRAEEAEKTLQNDIDYANKIVGIEKKGWLTTNTGAVMESGSISPTFYSAYTDEFEGGDIAVVKDGYYIFDARKVSADGVAEMVTVRSRRLRTEKGYTYQLNISKDNNTPFSEDELEGIVVLYNYKGGDGTIVKEINENRNAIAEEVKRAEKAEKEIAGNLDALTIDVTELQRDIPNIKNQAARLDGNAFSATANEVNLTTTGVNTSKQWTVSLPTVTQEKAGVMSAGDKKALDDVPKNIAKEKTAIVNGDTIAGLAREVYSRTGKVDYATFLKRTTAGGTTISDGVASIKEIGGNIVKNMIDLSIVTATNSTKIDSGNISIFQRKGNDRFGFKIQTNRVVGHIYYFSCYVKTEIEDNVIFYIDSSAKYLSISNNRWIHNSCIVSATNTTSITTFNIGDPGSYKNSYAALSSLLLIDLTERYGAGKEPTKEECDRLFGNMDALPQGLTIAQPTGLKSTGYNQCNPVNVLRNKGIVGDAIEDDVENSHIAVVECLPCKIGEGENNGYVIGYGEGGVWDDDGIEVYFSPLNPMEYYDKDVDLYMHKLERDETYMTYVPQCKGYLLVVTPTIDKLCVNFRWSGDRSMTDYEEYIESNVALPEIPQMSEWGLAGIQSSGSLVADTIDLDRMVYTKSIGAVDLGSLNWSKYLDKFFIASLIGAKDNTNMYAYSNCTTSKYSNAIPSEIYNLTQTGISLGSAGILINGKVLINDQTYADAASLKSSLQGVMLYYELAEPEEYPIVTKASPNYIGSDYGVEEFTGSKVPLNANILFYMRSLVGETRNFLDRLYDNTDKTDAKEVADYITNGIEGNKELATNAPNLALRALFIAEGAKYNDTDQIIQKTAPWGETVQHLPKHYYLNGLGDITEKQMMAIYNMGKYWLTETTQGFGFEGARTNLPPKSSILYYYKIFNFNQAFNNPDIEVVNLVELSTIGTVRDRIKISSLAYFTQSANKLKRVIGKIDVSNVSLDNSKVNGPSLEFIYINNLKISISFYNSPSLKKESVQYMIENAKPTSAITITLHADAYARLAEDADIVAVLEAQPLVTLVSA